MVDKKVPDKNDVFFRQIETNLVWCMSWNFNNVKAEKLLVFQGFHIPIQSSSLIFHLPSITFFHLFPTKITSIQFFKQVSEKKITTIQKFRIPFQSRQSI